MKAWVYGSLDTILRDAHITSFTVDTEQPGNYYVTTEIEVLPAADYEAMEAAIGEAEKFINEFVVSRKLIALGYEGTEGDEPNLKTAIDLLARLRALGKG